MNEEALRSPRHFHAWYLQQVKLGSTVVDLLDAIGDRSEIARCRQLCVAYWLNQPCDLYLDACLFSTNKLVEAYAMSFDIYRSVAKFATETDKNYAEAHNFAPIVRRFLKELRDQKSDFAWEVDASLRMASSLTAYCTEDFETAEEEAALGRYRANRVGASISASRLVNMLISVRAQRGDISAALQLIEHEEGSPSVTFANLAFQERARAIFEYQLGNHDKAVSRLEAGIRRFDTPGTNMINMATELQRIQCVLGTGGLEGPVLSGLSTHMLGTCIVRSMRELLRAGALPRTNRALDSRNAHLKQAVEFWTSDIHHKNSWGKILGRWILGTANLWQGKASLALRNVEEVDVNRTEWLDLRTLLAGLKLELALNFHLPDLPITSCADELRAVFEEARMNPLASPQGLATHLIRWHPSAAIYCSLMPDNIAELQNSVEGLLKVGHRNEVYGIHLPPSLAAELVLRSLDFDLRPNVNFVQSDPGPSRNKAARLRIEYGEVDYWRPCTSAVKILYGLVKAGYLDTANAVYHEFGVSPRSSSGYPMLPLVEMVDAAVSDLLAQKTSPDVFARQLTLID